MQAEQAFGFPVQAKLDVLVSNPDTVNGCQDSRTSSGFSFSDMTANRVGTRLGILSNASESAAENLQRFFAAVEREDSFMPPVGRPDGISEEEFIRRYGSRNSEAYDLRISDIEQEIDELPVFQANSLP